MKAVKVLVVASLASLTAACSSVSEMKPVGKTSFPQSYVVSNVIVEDKTGKDYELEGGAQITALMKEAMSIALDKAGKSGTAGSGLSYEINIVDYQEGNAFARWLMPGAGKTILSVEGVVAGVDGDLIATTQATESISAGGGFTIGAWKTVFANVAEMLVDDLP